MGVERVTFSLKNQAVTIDCVLLNLSASTLKINKSKLYFRRCLRSYWCATSTGKVLCIAHNVSSLALRNTDSIGSHTRYFSQDVRYSLWHQIFTTPRRQMQERSSTNPNLLPPSLTSAHWAMLPQDWPLLPLEDPRGPTRMTVVLDCQWRWWVCVCVCEYGSNWPEDHTTPHNGKVSQDMFPGPLLSLQ